MEQITRPEDLLISETEVEYNNLLEQLTMAQFQENKSVDLICSLENQIAKLKPTVDAEIEARNKLSETL